MWWMDYWPMPWMLLGPVMMIVFVIICAGLIVMVMRGEIAGHPRGGSAISILKERYARGEISQAEFEERRRFLEQ